MLKQTASRKLWKMYSLPDNIMVVSIRREDACSTSGENYKCTKILINKTTKQQTTEGKA
jgi:hypothetical protein